MDVHVSLVGRKNLSGEIYRQLRRAILEGKLRPGDRLPPSRELARRLSVSRTTATVAYDRLAIEGFVTSRAGSGTFVSKRVGRTRFAASTERGEGVLQARPIWDAIPLPAPFAKPAQFDFRPGLPDASLFPHRSWARFVARAVRARAVASGVYADAAGQQDLREAIVRHIGVSRGVEAAPEDIIITNGTQQAIDVVARTLLSPGNRVAVEDPSYTPPRRLLESLGMQVEGVPVDRDGLVVDALSRYIRLVYVTPSHQHPLGVSMTLERRQALLDWAERHNAAIVEDDYDSEFRFGGRPLDPLQTLDTAGRVIYVGSFSKTMLPTLRLGFIVAPPSLRLGMQKAKFVADWHTSTLVQTALARFIDEGAFARHLRRMSTVYHARHEILSKALATDFADYLELIPSSTGLHMAAIARTATADQVKVLVDRAADAGVALQTLSYFGMRPAAPVGLILGYGAIATTDIQDGLHRLRKLI